VTGASGDRWSDLFDVFSPRPVARAPSLVSHRNYDYLIILNNVKDGIREPPQNAPTYFGPNFNAAQGRFSDPLTKRLNLQSEVSSERRIYRIVE
jgi:hypothetical protein